MTVDFPFALGIKSLECFNSFKTINKCKNPAIKFGQFHKDTVKFTGNSNLKLNYDKDKLSEDDIIEIKEILKGKDENEMCVLAAAIARSRDPYRDTVLLSLSRKNFDTVKCCVAKTLGQMEDPKALNKIIERFKYISNPKVKTELGKAAGTIKDENTRNIQFMELYFLKDPDIDAGLAQNLNPKKIDEDNLSTVIMGYANHNNPKIRASAALNLDKTNNENISSTYKVLRHLCYDENEEVRRNAARHISLVYDTDFLDLPIDDPDFVGVMNEPESLFDLNDTKTRAKAEKIEKLAELKKLQKPDFVFDWYAIDILDTLDELDKLTDPKNREELDKLVRLKRENKPRNEACFSFSWEDPYLIEKVKNLIMPDFLNEKRNKGKIKISDDYNAIINDLAKDPDSEVRFNLVIGLSEIPDKNKRDDFLCCFSKKGSKERQAVAKVIDKVCDPDKRDEIIERLSNPEDSSNSIKVMEYIAPALAKVQNPEVFKRVSKNLLNNQDNKYRKVKIEVAKVLEKICPKYRDEVAECISKDPDPEVLKILAENAKHMINKERRRRLYHELFLKYTNISSRLKQKAAETQDTFNTASPPIYS